MFRPAIELISLTATALCCVHLWLSTRSIARVVRFFSGAVFLGALAEAAAILVTGGYDYPGFNLYIGPVPLFVAVGWGTSFYCTHGVATAVCGGFLDRARGIWLVGFAAGIVGVLVDLCFDPVAVSLGWWVWKDGSPYFGVPIANFLGWFAFCMGFSVAHTWSDAHANLGFLKQTLLFYSLLVVVFIVTALVSFPFLRGL